MTEQITPEITTDQLTDAEGRDIYAAARRIIADAEHAGTDALDSRATDWMTTITRQTAMTITFEDEDHTVHVTTVEAPGAAPVTTAAAVQIEHHSDVLLVALPLDHPLAQVAAEFAYIDRPKH